MAKKKKKVKAEEVKAEEVKAEEVKTETAPKCGDCGGEVKTAAEAESGLCNMCGPGSARYQEKNPDYLHPKQPLPWDANSGAKGVAWRS